ncbi:MAG: hypothetical protein WDO13_06205 [Verrucomicrobiota bacterium]
MPAELTCREACTEALLNDEHIVCGLRLRPFCLEMWLILTGAESPLVGGGAITIADLQFAALVCATANVEEFYATSRRPNWRWRLWKFIWRTQGQVSDELAKFNRYVDDYCPNFPRWNFDQVEPAKCPDVMLCAAKLVAAGQPLHEVKREIPLGEILAWGLAMDEAAGKPLDAIQSDTELNPPPEQLEAFYAGR